MNDRVAVRTNGNKIANRIYDISWAHLRYGDDMVDMNKISPKASISSLEIKAANLAGIPLCSKTKAPVVWIPLVLIGKRFLNIAFSESIDIQHNIN